jgi:hypothetical protein
MITSAAACGENQSMQRQLVVILKNSTATGGKNQWPSTNTSSQNAILRLHYKFREPSNTKIETRLSIDDKY